MDPRCAPQRVFLTHPSDEITQATIDLRAPYPLSRFPSPEGFEASAMPTKNGLRLNQPRTVEDEAVHAAARC